MEGILDRVQPPIESVMKMVHDNEHHLCLVGRFFALFAILLTLIQILRIRCTAYQSRDIQICIVRIIFFVLFYSLDAIISMSFATPDSRQGLPIDEMITIAREGYEVVTVLAFVALVLECMGGTDEIRKAIESQRQYARNPYVFGCCLRDCIQRLFCCFRCIYRPGTSMLSTILVGILQFAFVLLPVVLFKIILVVMQASRLIEPQTVENLLTVFQILKVLSTMWAMYQIFMLEGVLEENVYLRERFGRMQPKLKFWFFKIPVLLTMWLDALTRLVTKRFGVDPHDALFLLNLVVCVLMLVFALLSFAAFPPEQLRDWEDKSPAEDTLHTIQILKDVLKLRELARNRKTCMAALAEFQRNWPLLDLDSDGRIDRAEFMYLCECAGLSGNTHEDLLNAMGKLQSIDMRDVFPEMVRGQGYEPPVLDIRALG